MPTRDSIIVLGLLGQFPMAGIAWQLLHHVLGLQRLGFAVYYLEDTGTAPYDPRAKSLVHDCTYSVRYIAETLHRVGMRDAWAYRDGLSGQWHGLAESRVRELCAHAVCTLNLCGASDPASLAFRPHHNLVYLETDPVLYQVRLTENDPAAVRFLSGHDAHVTYGENLGADDCPVPLPRFAWKKTRPPVILDCWPVTNDPHPTHFTTIATWHNRGKDLWFRGESYQWSKHHNFLSLVQLPQQTTQPLELAVEIDDVNELATVQRHGWRLTNPLAVSQDMDVYHQYIDTARGEFTVSKDAVVRTKSGWFSDRSVCFLAAGKPVVTQETGFEKYIPTGHGLFAFKNQDDICAAFETINHDYARHARAAHEIAQEYFAAEKLLRKILDEVGV